MANNTNKKEATGFTFTGTTAQASTGRTIPGSAELISTCNTLALDAIKLASTDPEIGKLAAAVQSGDHEALVAFVDKAIEVPDKSMLDGATEDELSRLLESRRSDRSKAKKAGLTTLDTIRRYISAWIAELVIRAASGKAYKAPSTGFSVEDMDGADRDTITKKIKSLQSKRCRLNQAYRAIVAAGAQNAELKNQIDQLDAEIKKLNDLRGVQPKAVKTSNTVPTNDQLAAYLKSLSTEELQDMLAKAAQ
jgi:cell division protein FtsB